MALKSSQPRRSASLKSERPILRTTYAVETPNNCSLGLAKYCVAMAPVSLLVVAEEEGRALKRRTPASRAKIATEPGQTKFNEKELCRATPIATGAVSLARWRQEAR